MTPFIALQLSPTAYLPRWRWLEEPHPFGLEVGLRRNKYALGLSFTGMYIWNDPVIRSLGAFNISTLYRNFNLTLYRYTGNVSPFLSLNLAKPIVLGMIDPAIDRFNSSLRGTSYGVKGGVSYVLRYRFLFIAPSLGLSYYPHLPIYKYHSDGEIMRLETRIDLLRVFASVWVGLGK